jgi:hypothetical protein
MQIQKEYLVQVDGSLNPISKETISFLELIGWSRYELSYLVDRFGLANESCYKGEYDVFGYLESCFTYPEPELDFLELWTVTNGDRSNCKIEALVRVNAFEEGFFEDSPKSKESPKPLLPTDVEALEWYAKEFGLI